MRLLEQVCAMVVGYKSARAVIGVEEEEEDVGTNALSFIHSPLRLLVRRKMPQSSTGVPCFAQWWSPPPFRNTRKIDSKFDSKKGDV